MSKIPFQTANPEELFIPGVDTPNKEGRFTHVRPANYKFDRNLLASIRLLGVTTAVNTVDATVDVGDGKMETRKIVKDGRRRVLHAREVNRMMAEEGDKSPRVRVPEKYEGEAGDSEEAENMFYLQAEAANQHHADDDQLTRANRWLQYKTRGVTPENIAISAGVNVQTVRAGIRVAEGASAVVRKALKDGEINFTVAANLCKIDGAEAQGKALEELRAEAEGEGGKITSGKAKAKAKGKGSGGGAQTMTASDVRTTIIGLEAEVANTKKGTREHERLITMIDTFIRFLCEGYNDLDKELGKANYDTLHGAWTTGKQLQKAAKKAKASGKKAEAADDGEE